MTKIFSIFSNNLQYCSILIVFLLGACAGTPKPVAEIASAKTALAAAEKIEADKYAIVEFDRAQNKLALAQKELQKGDNDEARRLAEQALAEAEYASAKTVATRVNASTKQMEDSVHMIKNQIKQ